ncbi:MAG: hypothetical protein U9R16_02455 [Campylobacterota bacterium]|nr:hypothetical protein [Campylobacterota bacterium]
MISFLIKNRLMILWLKRVVGTIMISLWLFIIYNITQIQTDMTQQMLFCMLSTMAIFTTLTFLFKFLERIKR